MTRVEGLEEVKLALKLVRFLRNALCLCPRLSLARTGNSGLYRSLTWRRRLCLPTRLFQDVDLCLSLWHDVGGEMVQSRRPITEVRIVVCIQLSTVFRKRRAECSLATGISS